METDSSTALGSEAEDDGGGDVVTSALAAARFSTEELEAAAVLSSADSSFCRTVMIAMQKKGKQTKRPRYCMSPAARGLGLTRPVKRRWGSPRFGGSVAVAATTTDAVDALLTAAVLLNHKLRRAAENEPLAESDWQ